MAAWIGRAVTAAALCGTAVVLCDITGAAQTLARPGWAGSGLTVQRWWTHAVIVEIDVPDGEAERSADVLRRTTEQLDSMRGGGVDALLLRGLGDPGPTAAGASASGPGEARTAFDELVSQSGRRGIRLLVAVRGDLPAAQLASTARMWLNHGAAGIEVAGGGAEATRTVRSAMHQVRGDCLLVSGDRESGAAAPATDFGARGARATGPRATAAAAELPLMRIAGLGAPPSVAMVRSSVESAAANGRGGGILLEAAGTATDAADMARVRAALTLLSAPGAALLDRSSLGADGAPSNAVDAAEAGATAAGQPASRPVQLRPADEHSVAAQTRQMTGLHHDRAAFLAGATTVLDHDAAGAAVWLRRGAGGEVLAVVCNVSGQPIRLSLADDVVRLRLRGTFLKTISRSDNGLGAMPLDAVTVPAFGVYVGELSR